MNAAFLAIAILTASPSQGFWSGDYESEEINNSRQTVTAEDLRPLVEMFANIEPATVKQRLLVVVFSIPNCGPCKRCEEINGDGDDELLIWRTHKPAPWPCDLYPAYLDPVTNKVVKGLHTTDELKTWAAGSAKPKPVGSIPIATVSRQSVQPIWEAARRIVGESGEITATVKRHGQPQDTITLTDAVSVSVANPQKLTWTLDRDAVRFAAEPPLKVSLGRGLIGTDQRLDAVRLTANELRFELRGVPALIEPVIRIR